MGPSVRSGRARRLFSAAGAGSFRSGGRVRRQLPARLPPQKVAGQPVVFLQSCSSPAWCWSSSPGRLALSGGLGGHVLRRLLPGDLRARKGRGPTGRLDLSDRDALGVAFLFLAFVLLGRQAGGLEFEAFRRMPALSAAGAGVDLRARPGRLRRQGRVRSVPRLAAGGAPGRPFARVGLDVGRDDQDGPLRDAAHPDIPGRTRSLVGADAGRARACSRHWSASPWPCSSAT